MASFWVTGIVSAIDKQPYIQLSNEKGMIAQLSMGQARNIAMDILNMAARTEVDAMIHNFCAQYGKAEMGPVLMQHFRDYRAKIDQEKIEREIGEDPNAG